MILFHPLCYFLVVLFAVCLFLCFSLMEILVTLKGDLVYRKEEEDGRKEKELKRRKEKKNWTSDRAIFKGI